MMGNLGLLQDGLGAEDPALGYTKTALRAAQRGAELVDRLLAFSRKQVLAPERTNISATALHFRQMARQVLSEEIELKTRLADDPWAVVVDAGQLESALLNLAINARDAMPRGGELLIETANRTISPAQAQTYGEMAPGEYVMIAISDNGTGMTADTKAKVFEPFFTTKEVGQGTGLGLSMVFGFAKQSGGHVALESDLGQGTTVRIFLPREATATSTATSKGIGRISTLPRGTETIMLVEDDGDVRNMTLRLLDSLGYQVISASDGPSALARLEAAENVDLLLTDVVLPGGMSGADIAEHFRRRPGGGRVLFASGYPRDLLDKQKKISGDVDLLKKPYQIADLAKEVRRVLDK
jgi:CheY-like chemotaxis protein